MDPVQAIRSLEMGVLRRLTSPVVSSIVSTDSALFQRSGVTYAQKGGVASWSCDIPMLSRQKSGIWGFRSDKIADVGGYQAKV